MSLLMQALKKAERAKQNSGQESELDKPSEAFDDILALAPAEPAAAPAPAKPGLALDLEPLAGLSLSPLEPSTPLDTRSGAPTGAHATGIAPPQTEPAHATPALQPLDLATDDLPPIPVLSVATEAIHDPVPPQARHAEPPLDTPAPAAASASARVKAELKADLQAAEAAKTAAAAGAAAPRGAAARARAAAAAAAPVADKTGMDPAKLRIAILSGIVALIVLGYGYYFWQATSGPGAGARLPMVPMPPPNATGATAAVVVVPTAAGAGDASAAHPAVAPGQGDSPAALSDKAAAEDRRRRDMLFEREQMVAQQQAALQAQALAQAQAAAAPHPAAGPDTLPPVVAAESSEIRVARTTQAPQVDPALAGGYQALGSGDLATAQQQYGAALGQDPNNRDALLGTAAVALRQHQDERAAATYARLLELDPNDADALAGLVGLHQGDANQSELRLKNVLKQKPDSAPLLFALGNLYARQGRWPEAQQTYFRAYTAAPGNADYAFNLAIGLDRLNQPKLALTYYQRALALAQDRPAGFDRDALRKRMQQLGAPAQP